MTEQMPLDFSHPTLAGHIEAYLQAALDWTEYLEDGSPMSVVFTVDDFTADTVEMVRGLLFTFMKHPHVARLIDTHNILPECVGARLWTLHTNQGIGFWDDTGDSVDSAIMDTLAKRMLDSIEVKVAGGPEGSLHLEVKYHGER